MSATDGWPPPPRGGLFNPTFCFPNGARYVCHFHRWGKVTFCERSLDPCLITVEQLGCAASPRVELVTVLWSQSISLRPTDASRLTVAHLFGRPTRYPDCERQFRGGGCPRHQPAEGRAGFIDVARDLGLGQHANARNNAGSHTNVRRELFPNGCGHESDTESVLGIHPCVHENSTRRSEWGWLNAMLFRVRLRERSSREVSDGGLAMCTEPALQSFNPFSSMGPPSVLGEITEHQHVPYRAGPNARQLLSPAPSPRRSWSSHLPRFFVAQPPRRSPSISLPPFGGAALPGGVLPEEAWEACLGSELLCDHAQRPELPSSLTGMAVRDRDGCSSEAEGSQPCQKDSSQGLFHVISICSTGRWPSLNSTSVRGRVGLFDQHVRLFRRSLPHGDLASPGTWKQTMIPG